MLARPAMRTVLALLAAALLPACAQSEPDLVRVRAASQLQCDARSVAVREVRAVNPEETLYEASACGKVAQYRCTKTLTDAQPGTRGATMAPRQITVCKAEPQ
jgi:hypothetical protein